MARSKLLARVIKWLGRLLYAGNCEVSGRPFTLWKGPCKNVLCTNKICSHYSGGGGRGGGYRCLVSGLIAIEQVPFCPLPSGWVLFQVRTHVAWRGAPITKNKPRKVKSKEQQIGTEA